MEPARAGAHRFASFQAVAIHDRHAQERPAALVQMEGEGLVELRIQGLVLDTRLLGLVERAAACRPKLEDHVTERAQHTRTSHTQSRGTTPQ
jgi:hypothetical protein